MEQTKGYETLKGRIYGLEKDPKTNQSGNIRSLNLKIQTNKDNSKFVQVGKWKNSSLTIKIKGKGMEEPMEVLEQEAIEKIKELFNEGDSVFVTTRVDINTYSKRIDTLVNQIYIQSEEVDFDKEDFKEVNEINQKIIITEKPEREDLKVGVADYKGNMIEIDVKLLDEDVRDYFIENSKVGDLMNVTMRTINKPIYADEEKSEGRKTLKGKIIGKSSGGRKINGFESYIEIIDVDLDKTEVRKYTREEIRQALEGNSVNNKSINQKKQDDEIKTETEDNDLPF